MTPFAEAANAPGVGAVKEARLYRSLADFQSLGKFGSDTMLGKRRAGRVR
jgi:hypothetical protein